jgi:hypothetical protein
MGGYLFLIHEPCVRNHGFGDRDAAPSLHPIAENHLSAREDALDAGAVPGLEYQKFPPVERERRLARYVEVDGALADRDSVVAGETDLDEI